MRRLFRRSTRADETDRSQSTTSKSEPTLENATHKKTTFFDLPAELRNDIYEYLAKRTTLLLVDSPTILLSGAKHKKASLIPALLLASRQCRSEYLPILLCTAPVRAAVTGCDFRHLTKVSASLYRTELKALRENAQLHVEMDLRCCRPSSQMYVLLRRWCISRAKGLDRLPWKYRVKGASFSGLEGMRGWCEEVRRLYERTEDETVKWEVRRVLEALDVEWERLGELPNSTWNDGDERTGSVTLQRRGLETP